MPIKRGFVAGVEATRTGLVRVFLIHADGSEGAYVIPPIDTDPNQFNQRLSKLAIAQNAMNRAEPVEIEHVSSEIGEVIDRIKRMKRDDLGPVGRIQPVSGFISDLMVHSENGVLADGEKPDLAVVFVLKPDMTTARVELKLQGPERLVKSDQLKMLLDAQSRGRVVRLLVDGGTLATSENEAPRIISVAVDNADNDFGGEQATDVNGFVESLSLLRIPSVGATSMASSFALVRFTTAPPFTGTGNVVGLAPFSPTTISLLVLKNSLAYELFLEGLENNLRMRASLVPIHGRSVNNDESPNTTNDSEGGTHTPVLRMLAAAAASGGPELFISFGAELLAPLASASRPVWFGIWRESLDIGPEQAYCAEGTPSSDLTPQSLRDLHIPYPAVWRGLACFNHGIYRFQLKLPSPFRLIVNGKELCLHNSDPAGSKLAHACLHDACEVIVEIEKWTCDSDFVMDVYRLR